MNIDNKKLNALHKFIQGGGSPEREDLANHIEVTVDDMQPYVDAMKAKWPDIYDPKDEDEAGVEIKKEDINHPEYFLVENGIKVPLSHKGYKNGQVFLEKIEPKDEVTVRVAGKDVVVDLLKLEIESAKLGVSVEQLRVLGEVAKG